VELEVPFFFLLPLAERNWPDGIGKSHFLQCNRNLPAIRCSSGIQLDHRTSSGGRSQCKSISEANGMIMRHASQSRQPAFVRRGSRVDKNLANFLLLFTANIKPKPACPMDGNSQQTAHNRQVLQHHRLLHSRLLRRETPAESGMENQGGRDQEKKEKQCG